jgi:hypothetical protein
MKRQVIYLSLIHIALIGFIPAMVWAQNKAGMSSPSPGKTLFEERS